MRILVSNDGFSDVGGVQTYLDAVIEELADRGHTLAIGYCTDSGASEVGATLRRFHRFHLSGQLATSGGLGEVRRWAPDVCFSHNMHDLSVDSALAATAPVVKFMHGYFGTCIGGLKTHAFPHQAACERTYGPACLALYLPRRCGRFSPMAMVTGWRWAEQQRALMNRYATVVVASEHMRDEFVRSGGNPDRVLVNALFPTWPVSERAAAMPADPHVVFLGRMTALKGGDLLVRATRDATSRLGRPVRLTMAGDGPERHDWEELARRIGVPCTFPGWLNGGERRTLIEQASLVVLPSRWPEPFGLVGLEAAAVGVPAVAVDCGGVRQWLTPEKNGVLVEAPATPESLGHALTLLLSDTARLGRLRAGAWRRAGEMTLAGHVDRLVTLFEGVCARRLAS
jgi:glycosyltransferase involved in cell wall biosynthesis